MWRRCQGARRCVKRTIPRAAQRWGLIAGPRQWYAACWEIALAIMNAARMMVSCACVLVASSLLSGCASGPSPLVKLQEARTTLERARSAETADSQAIEEAEDALSYAEAEYRLAPRHPLSQARAEKALEKARAALGATVATQPALATAH
jgi:hypothetical protein